MCKNYFALGISLDGGFAEYVRIPEQAVRAGNVIELEDHVTYAQAAITKRFPAYTMVYPNAISNPEIMLCDRCRSYWYYACHDGKNVKGLQEYT